MEGFPWLSDEPSRDELERLTAKQLFALCVGKKGLKPILVEFLMSFKKLR